MCLRHNIRKTNKTNVKGTSGKNLIGWPKLFNSLWNFELIFQTFGESTNKCAFFFYLSLSETELQSVKADRFLGQR